MHPRGAIASRSAAVATPTGRGVAVLALALLVAGCQAGARVPETAQVTLAEYRIEPPAAVEAGRVVFAVTNTGELEHELLVVRLPEDLPPLDEQLRGTNRRHVLPLAGLPPVPPGADATFAADLTAGRYGLVCFLTDADGQPHALEGMNAEFVVR